MRSRAPLALMEQMVMLLVFALAAALCLQAFVKSDSISRQSEARDRAAMLVQSAAEAIQSCGGDACDAFTGAAELLGGQYEQGLFWLDYDENWNPGGDAYRLEAQGILTDNPALREAVVQVVDAQGEPVFSIQIAWQGEVRGNG